MGYWTDSTIAARSAHFGLDDIAYARAKLAAGVPRPHIARMMGRSLAMVRLMLPEVTHTVAAPEPAAVEPEAPPAPRVDPNAMLAAGHAIAFKHGLPLAVIRGRSRARAVSRARQELCWTIYQLRFSNGARRFSQVQIAAFVGLIDHAAVSHAIRLFDALKQSTNDVGCGSVMGDEHPKIIENQTGEAAYDRQPHPSKIQTVEV